MTITTLSSRQFNQDAGKAKKAAIDGPAIMTDRGRPSHVLLTFAEYKRITSGRTKIAHLLAMPGIEDIELNIPPLRDLAIVLTPRLRAPVRWRRKGQSRCRGQHALE